MVSHKIGYLGFGSYTPPRVLTNEDLEKVVDTSDEWIQRRTGVRTRRILGKGETVLGMALEAARRALDDAGVTAEAIGDIRVATNTWMRFPSLATQVQRKLGIDTCSASDVSAGCAGFVYAVEEAHHKILAEKALYGRDLTTLVVGVDGLSLVTNWADRNTCVLLGDGAGAVIMGMSEGAEILATHTEASGKYGDLLYLDDFLGGQDRSRDPFEFSHAEGVDRPYLRMDGRKIFPVAVRTMTRVVKEVLRKHNDMYPDARIEASQIDYVYPHQANIRIIQSVADALEIPIEKVYTEGVAKYGNTSTASIPIGYDEIRQPSDGHLFIDVAFGAGFASGAILRRS